MMQGERIHFNTAQGLTKPKAANEPYEVKNDWPNTDNVNAGPG